MFDSSLPGPVPATISLMLPCELVERILLLLDINYVLTCRLVNREFNDLIQSSTLLQYFLACEAAGVIDNPRSPLSYPERHEALKRREEAWKNLKPMFETTIKVNHQSSPFSTFYGLTGGAYFFDDDSLEDLYYCPLPSSPQDNPRWIKIRGHPGEGWPGIFINSAVSEYEHDLIINAISSDIGHQQDPERSIDLVLLKLSTQEYHPLAHHPQIHVQRSQLPKGCILRIVGDNLAMVVRSSDYIYPDRLFIFDWKSGHKRLQHETTGNTYRDLVFVSPELLLVPNVILSHFEVWYIPPSHPNPHLPVQILSLRIPTVSPDYTLFDVGCNGMPNPFLNSMPYFPPRPFFSSPENSIIIVSLCLEYSPEMRNVTYALIMHRCTLLDTIKRLTSPSALEQQQDLPIWLTNEVTLGKLADPDAGSVRLDVKSNLTSTMPHPGSSPQTHGSSISPSTPTSHITADSSSISSTTSSTSRYHFGQVQWTDWGPPISRLFQVSGIQAELTEVWAGQTSGQRYVFTIPSPHNLGKSIISVADFNPYTRRRNVESMARLRGEGVGDSDNCDNEAWKTKEEEWEKLAHEGAFSEDVYMGLKCVIYHAPDEYEFDQLLMDEERLVGLKFPDADHGESVTVLYIG